MKLFFIGSAEFSAYAVSKLINIQANVVEVCHPSSLKETTLEKLSSV